MIHTTITLIGEWHLHQTTGCPTDHVFTSLMLLGQVVTAELDTVDIHTIMVTTTCEQESLESGPVFNRPMHTKYDN